MRRPRGRRHDERVRRRRRDHGGSAVRKIIPIAAAGAAALVIAGGTFGYVSANKDVTLSVDGAAAEVHSTAGTVGDLLKARGISLTDHDVVAPAPEARLSDGTRIAVQYGRPVTVKVDGKPRT